MKTQIDVSVIKHTGKSVFNENGAKRIVANFLNYDNNTTLCELMNKSYGITIEPKENNEGLVITLKKGGTAIKTMNEEEFISKMLSDN